MSQCQISRLIKTVFINAKLELSPLSKHNLMLCSVLIQLLETKKQNKVITLKSYLSWATRAKTSKTDITEPFMVCSSRLVEPESENLVQPDSDL